MCRRVCLAYLRNSKEYGMDGAGWEDYEGPDHAKQDRPNLKGFWILRVREREKASVDVCI